MTFFSKRDSEWSVCSISKHILESIFLNREYFDDVYFEALSTANFSAIHSGNVIFRNSRSRVVKEQWSNEFASTICSQIFGEVMTPDVNVYFARSIYVVERFSESNNL